MLHGKSNVEHKKHRASWKAGSVAFFGLLLISAASVAADFYVSPTASGSGTGSFSNPWQLQTALNQPSGVNPGDTIWPRGGTYSGIYTGRLNGTASQPIVVRGYAGEWAKIDGGNSAGQTILITQGSYTWYWGFEIMSSYGHRLSTQTGSSPTDILYGAAIDIDQSINHPGLKFFNLVLHDTRAGFGWWKQ